MSKALLLVLLVCSVLVSAKYEHNVDVTDWSHKNIGQIKDAIVDRSKIYFLGVNGLFGHMDKLTGNIDLNNGIDATRKLSWKNWEPEHNEKLVVQDSQGLFVYNFLKGAIQSINSDSLEGDFVESLVLSSEKYLVLTTSRLLLVTKTSIEVILQAPEGQVFLQLIRRNKQTIRVLVETEDKVCVQSWATETLVELSEDQIQVNDKACLAYEGGVRTYLASPELLLVGSKVLLLESSTTVAQPEFASIEYIHLDYKSSVMVIVSQMKAFFYSVRENQLEQIYKFDQPGPYEFAFDKQAGTPNSLSFLVSMKGQSRLHTLDLKTNNVVVVAKFTPRYKESTPRQFWLKVRETQELLIQDHDFRTYFVDISQVKDAQELGSGEIWSREDGLSSLDGLLMVDYNQAQTKKINPYYESLDKDGVNNPLQLVQNFVKRVTYEVQNYIEYFKQNYSLFSKLLKGISEVRSYKDLISLNKIITHDEEYEINYGLKKIVVGVNKNRTIYSLDSKTGELLWKTSFIQRYVTPDYNFHGFFQVENRKDGTITEETLLIYHSPVTTKLFLFTIQPLKGDLGWVGRHFMPHVKKVFKMRVEAEGVQQAVVIIDSNMNVYSYPNITNPLDEDKHDNIFYMFDQESNSLNGYRYAASKFNRIWNYYLAPGEVLVDVQSSSNNEQVHPKIALFDDTKVILKHIDYSNIAILTKREKPETLSGNGQLSLTLLNCKSGRQIYSHYEQNVDLKFPMNLIYDENGVFVSYFNPVQSIYVIWTVELFSNRMENSFVSMLQNYYFSSTTTNGSYENFDYLSENLDIVALEQKYGYSLGVKRMSVVKTKLSLTKRNLVIITPNNQIHSLDRDMLSTRRAVKIAGQESIASAFSFESTTLPPYSFLLPIDRTNVLSYYKNLNDLKDIQFSGSNFESTILYIAYGNDIFMGSIAPDRTFDMISEEFNYVIVILSIFVAMVGVVMSRRYYLKATFERIFENKENVTTM